MTHYSLNLVLLFGKVISYFLYMRWEILKTLCFNKFYFIIHLSISMKMCISSLSYREKKFSIMQIFVSGCDSVKMVENSGKVLFFAVPMIHLLCWKKFKFFEIINHFRKIWRNPYWFFNWSYRFLDFQIFWKKKFTA